MNYHYRILCWYYYYYFRLFGNREEERKKDTEIISKLKKLNWITLKHMEVHESVGEDKSSITLACTGLLIIYW